MKREMWDSKKIENKDVIDESHVLQTLEFKNNNDGTKWKKADNICKFFIGTSNITEAEYSTLIKQCTCPRARRQ